MSTQGGETVGPLEAPEIIAWINGALKQLEYESDATGYLERLIEALEARGVSGAKRETSVELG